MGTLDDKVALVTGAGRGIGRAIAVELARRGAKTFALDVAIPESIEVGLWYKACDVTDVEWVKSTIDTIAQEFGGIDILVNNAGVTRDRSLKKLSVEEWQQVIDVDLSSVFYVSQAAAKVMIEQAEREMPSPAHRAIVSISSVVARTGNFGQANYAAAKAGILGFTRSVARELARHNITVNAVCPGFTVTQMTEAIPLHVMEQIEREIALGRRAQPEEIARVVADLCEWTYCTGAAIDVNGGYWIGG